MKRQGLFALTLSIMLILSACGTPSSNTPSNTGSDDKPSSTVSDKDTPASGNSVTDDFLKTITAETAEAKGVCGADLNWYYKDNVLVIKGTGTITEYKNYKEVPWNEYRDKINRVIIDEGCTALSNELFYQYYNLSSVFLPDSLTDLGDGSFSKCRELVSVKLGNNLESLGKSTFEGCEKLESITLPSSLQVIDDYAFLDCNSISNINIPDGVTEIGYCSLDGTAITSINIPNSVTTIGGLAFGSTNLESIIIPERVEILGGRLFSGCKNLKSVDIRTDKYLIDNGVIFNKDKTEIVCAVTPMLDGSDTYIVPDGVKIIHSLFDGNENIRNITFPSSITDVSFTSKPKQDTEYTLTFLGKAPEKFGFDGQNNPKITIIYSDNSFDEYISQYPDVNWIKQ